MPLETPRSPGGSRLPIGPCRTPRPVSDTQGASAPAPLPTFGQPNPPLGHAACLPHTAGFGPWVGVSGTQGAGWSVGFGLENETFSRSIVTAMKCRLCVYLQRVKPSLLKLLPSVSAAPRIQSPCNCFMSFSGHEEIRVTKDNVCWMDHLFKEEQAACRQGAIPPHRGASPAAKQWCNLHSKYHFRPVLLAFGSCQINLIKYILLSSAGNFKHSDNYTKQFFNSEQNHLERYLPSSAWGQKPVSFPFR